MLDARSSQLYFGPSLNMLQRELPAIAGLLVKHIGITPTTHYFSWSLTSALSTPCFFVPRCPLSRCSPRSTFEWPLLKRFYRSEVKVEVDSETKYTFAAEASFRRCGVVGVESYLSTEYSRWRPRTGSRNNYTSRAENTILHHACITAWWSCLQNLLDWLRLNHVISTLCWMFRLLRYYYFRLCPLFWKCTIQWSDHLEQSAACTTSSRALQLSQNAFIRSLKTHLFSTARHRWDISRDIQAPNINTLIYLLTYLLTYLLCSHFQYLVFKTDTGHLYTCV